MTTGWKDEEWNKQKGGYNKTKRNYLPSAWFKARYACIVYHSSPVSILIFLQLSSLNFFFSETWNNYNSKSSVSKNNMLVLQSVTRVPLKELSMTIVEHWRPYISLYNLKNLGLKAHNFWEFPEAEEKKQKRFSPQK